MSAWAETSARAADVSRRSENQRHARQAAIGGLIVALIFLLGSTLQLLPTADLFINLVMSILQLAALGLLGIKGALLVWLAASLLLMIWPGIPLCLGFLMVGGLYPLLRSASYRWRERTTTAWRPSFACALMAGLLLGLLTLFTARMGGVYSLTQFTDVALWPLWAVLFFYGLGLGYEIILTLTEPELYRLLRRMKQTL